MFSDQNQNISADDHNVFKYVQKTKWETDYSGQNKAILHNP